MGDWIIGKQMANFISTPNGHILEYARLFPDMPTITDTSNTTKRLDTPFYKIIKKPNTKFKN